MARLLALLPSIESLAKFFTLTSTVVAPNTRALMQSWKMCPSTCAVIPSSAVWRESMTMFSSCTRITKEVLAPSREVQTSSSRASHEWTSKVHLCRSVHKKARDPRCHWRDTASTCAQRCSTSAGNGTRVDLPVAPNVRSDRFVLCRQVHRILAHRSLPSQSTTGSVPVCSTKKRTRKEALSVGPPDKCTPSVRNKLLGSWPTVTSVFARQKLFHGLRINSYDTEILYTRKIHARSDPLG